MTLQPTSIQIVAGMLAATLLVVPAGPSLSIFHSLDHRDTGDHQGPSREGVVHSSVDCCPEKSRRDPGRGSNRQGFQGAAEGPRPSEGSPLFSGRSRYG